MELNLSSEDAAFRDEVRAFIAENYPQEMRVPNPETDLTNEQSLLWHRILHKKGWIFRRQCESALRRRQCRRHHERQARRTERIEATRYLSRRPPRRRRHAQHDPVA